VTYRLTHIVWASLLTHDPAGHASH
jgi:hypothetical protein